MGIKDALKWLGFSGAEAATTLPTVAPPKVKVGQQELPSYLRTAKPNPKNPLIAEDRALINKDITTYRQGANTRTVVRDFVKASPDLSAAVAAYIRNGVTNSYTAIAYNLDGTVNPEATSLLAQIVTRMDILNDYTIGFDDSPSIRSLAETWAGELMMYGGMAGELVLNKARLPDKIQPVNIGQIRLYPSADGKKLNPKQYLAGEEIDLNIPTFFMVTLDQDTLSAYCSSPIESALQAVLASADFLNDIRRILKRAIHPRNHVTIDFEQFKKSIPQDVAYDAVKFKEYMDKVLEDLANRVNDLKPEDALVTFSTIGIEVIDHGNTNLSNEYEVVDNMMKARMSTGAKVLPTILGHSDGTSNTASAEVLMFMKSVEGTVWGKLNEMFSKMFTLAIRLLGQDVYVKFSFKDINLKPESELESFYSMRQSRILDQLSIGLIGDDEASILLTGHLPPAGYKPLSGTGFRPTGSTLPAGEGYNGASNSGSTMNQNLKSDAPKGKKGGTPGNKAEVIPITG